MPKLAEVARISGQGTESLRRAAERVRQRAGGRDRRWQGVRERQEFERLMKQRTGVLR